MGKGKFGLCANFQLTEMCPHPGVSRERDSTREKDWRVLHMAAAAHTAAAFAGAAALELLVRLR